MRIRSGPARIFPGWGDGVVKTLMKLAIELLMLDISYVGCR